MDFLITGVHGDVGAQCVQTIEHCGCNWAAYNENVSDNARVLLHLAARHPVHDTDRLLSSNITYWQQVLAFSKQFCEKTLFCSSTSVYGSGRKGVVTESFDGMPDDAYGMTKWLGEKLFRESGTPGLSLRCPAILERHNSYNFMSTLFNRLQANETIHLFNADKPFNTFIAAPKLAQFAIQVSQRSLSSYAAINLSVNADLTLAAIVEIIRSELKSKSDINFNKDEGPWHMIDNQVARNEFGFEPGDTETQLKEWIAMRSQYCQEQDADD